VGRAACRRMSRTGLRSAPRTMPTGWRVTVWPDARASISARLLFNGTTEVVHLWTDPITGVDCKMCADCLPATFPNLIVDYKTAKDAGERGFKTSVRRYRYDVQAAFYLDGCASRSEFVFVVQETDAPYLIGIYALSADDIETGRQQYRDDLAVYQNCKQNNAWPDYNENKVTVL
jgi:hypothetical protein